MTLTQLAEWMRHPEQLNASTLYELRTIVARYPYFQSARLLYLQNLYLLRDAGFGSELRQSALYITDRSVLFRMFAPDALTSQPLYPEPLWDAAGEQGGEHPDADSDRTLVLIDAFLASHSDGRPRQQALDEAPSYSDRLQGGAPGGDAPTADGTSSPDAPGSEDEGFLTETLAQIYVRQHRYAKALDIIRKLSLKYPKKSIYFADQVRLLERLIESEKTKQ